MRRRPWLPMSTQQPRPWPQRAGVWPAVCCRPSASTMSSGVDDGRRHWTALERGTASDDGQRVKADDNTSAAETGQIGGKKKKRHAEGTRLLCPVWFVSERKSKQTRSYQSRARKQRKSTSVVITTVPVSCSRQSTLCAVTIVVVGWTAVIAFVAAVVDGQEIRHISRGFVRQNILHWNIAIL